MAEAMMRTGAALLCVLIAPATALAQQPRPTTTDAIVVTASPLGGDPDRFATIVTQVNRDAILTTGGANLADTLKDTPGVASTGFATGASRPIIRGMDSNRVRLLEDGLDSADVSEIGPDHGVPIDPLSAQSVEVVRGAATLRFGGQAIGGVVNAINNRVPRTLPREALSGEATASYADNSATGEGSLLLDARLGQVAFHADGFGRRASDYDTPLGVQNNSFFRGGGYSAGSSYFFGADNASHVGLGLVQYDARYGIPSDTTYIDMRQTKAMSSSSLHLDAGALHTLNVDLGYADYAHDEKDPDGTVESTFRNRAWDGRAEALFGAIGPFSATALGLQASKRNFSAGGDGEDYLFPTATRSAAVFAFTEAPLGARAHLQGAARIERVRAEGTPASNLVSRRDFTPVSGSLGVLYDVSDAVKFGVTLTSAARAPGQAELFARGAHDGPGTFETGDPALGIERVNSLEATLRIHTDRLHAEGALWGARFSDYIYGDLTGRTCDSDGACFSDDAHELRELKYGQRDAVFWGAEAKASFDLAHRGEGVLAATMLADMVRADFANGGGPVPRIPPYRVGGGLDWTGARFDAGFLLLYVGAQDRTPVGDAATKSYVSLDANAAWRFAPDMSLALSAHNLTDDVQRNAASLNRDLVAAPGRDVRVVLRRSF